ncbi:GNAT family N-acetyltransferase [Streptococcus thoraltensis]
MVQLQKASFSDLGVVQEIQRQIFEVWYDKYRDEHNPYLETKENIEEKFSRPTSFYYLIKEREKTVGFLRLQTNSEQKEGWLASVAIYPKEQRKGYASTAITLLSKLKNTVQLV